MPGEGRRPVARAGRAGRVRLALALGAVALGACAPGNGSAVGEAGGQAGAAHVDEARHAGGGAGGPLEITRDAQQNAGIRFVAADRAERAVPLRVTGVVTPDTSRVVHLRPLAEGVIDRVDVKLGDRVRAGQTLVVYDNVALGDHIGEYLGAVAARRQAEANLEVRRRSFERAEQLIVLEAIAQQTLDLRRSEFEQARATLMSAQAEVSRVEERIHRFGLTDDDLREVAPPGGADALRDAAERHREASLNVLRAPFDGVVTEYGVAIGDLVTPERELLTITDISTVWVLADVYEPDLGRLPPDAEVTIQVDAYPDRLFAGRLTYISDTIETSTRAAHVRCVVANPDDALKLGMFARVTIPTNETISALAVPIDAIQRIDDQPVVFVRTGATTFERRDVALGVTAGGQVEVVAGLAPGESIVAAGSFYLKTALLHERIGHAH